MNKYMLNSEVCIRCGVSSSVAPGLIALSDDDVAEIVRQPATDQELIQVEEARLLCPVGAISREEHR